MAAPKNVIASGDIKYGLTQEFVNKFGKDTGILMKMLGIVSPEVVGAGYTLVQHSVTGSLNNSGTSADGSSGTGYVEGELVALSKYTMTETTIEKAKLRPYRKVTTAQAIAEHGVVPAVVRTDEKLMADIRKDILKEFFTFLTSKGTGTAKSGGKTLQAALAYADAKLGDTMEDNADTPTRLIHFVNRADVADYLATAAVTTQTAFGLTYIQNFLGVENVFVTKNVTAGNVFVTDASNLHMYAQDFGALSQAGLDYSVSDDGLIGVAHASLYDHVSVETDVLTGMVLFPEVKDYIVKATFSAA